GPRLRPVRPPAARRGGPGSEGEQRLRRRASPRGPQPAGPAGEEARPAARRAEQPPPRDEAEEVGRGRGGRAVAAGGGLMAAAWAAGWASPTRPTLRRAGPFPLLRKIWAHSRQRWLRIDAWLGTDRGRGAPPLRPLGIPGPSLGGGLDALPFPVAGPAAG